MVAVALARPKVLVEENFLARKKEPEVAALETELQRMSEENRRRTEALAAVASKYVVLRSQYTEMASATTPNNLSSKSEGGSVSSSLKRKKSETSMDTAPAPPPTAAQQHGTHAHLHPHQLQAAADQRECT